MYQKIIEILGLLGIGGLLGSVVQHWLENRRSASERMSNLQKEVYFKLQEQAEKVFSELDLMHTQAKEMSFWLSKHVFTMELTTITKLERLQKMSSVSVYFSEDTLRAYDACATAFTKIADLYTDVGKQSELTQAHADAMPALLRAFEDSYRSSKEKIYSELATVKKSII